MAIVTVEGVQTFGMTGNAVGSSITAITQVNVGHAMGFQFFENAAITRFAVYVGAVTTNPSNCQIGFQTISTTTGLPSGTFLTSVAANSYTANSWNVFTLSTPYNVTAGDKLFAVWFNNTGSTINIGLNTQEGGARMKTLNPTYSASKTTTAGAWGKAAVAFPMYVGTATKWFGESHPFTTGINFTPNFTDEFGFSVTLPSNIPEVRLRQIEASLGISNINTIDITFKIYNSAGTLLQTIDTYDGAHTSLQNNTIISNTLHTHATDLWLTGGVKYYIMMALSGTGTFSVQQRVLGLDQNNSSTGIVSKYTSKVGTTFTESTNSYIPMRLICDAYRYDDATGGGGGGYSNASFMFTGGFSG